MRADRNGDDDLSIDTKKLGARIKSLRIDKKLSQEQLGELSGTIAKHISNIENGSRVPSLDMLISISNALNVSADDIVYDSLTNPNSMVGNEIQEILLDCNHDEKEMLIRTLKFLKALLSEFGI